MKYSDRPWYTIICNIKLFLRLFHLTFEKVAMYLN